MIQALYPAAQAVAPRVHAHFARHLATARGRGEPQVATLPDVESIAAMVDAAFWTSLRREEGYIPTVSLAFVAPDEARWPMRFERPLALGPGALTKVAPAVERPGIHLGVCRDGDRLVVWGTTRAIPTYCFVLEIAAPGLLVIKHARGEELAKFVNVAVLEGDQIKVIDEAASTLPDCPALLISLLGFASPTTWGSPVNVLVQLAVSMRAHGRGGCLLIVPSGTTGWLESIVQPVRYAVRPFTELTDLVHVQPEAGGTRVWQEALGRAVDAMAGLTAVDGATVMTDRYELLAFGAKIGRRDGGTQIEKVHVTEPVEGTAGTIVSATKLGGTRHLSAAQFAHDQRDAVALVASQDGRFTILTWSPCAEAVHGHRVEALLL